MNRRYDILYRLRITPWDHDEVSEQLKDFVGELTAPPGHALDVGCGSGRDAVYLASHGWTVTAVDGVRQALNAAQQRAHAAGVDVNWVHGDICQLEQLGIGDAYDLVLDRGCFHDLTDGQRDRWARGVTAVTDSHAMLLISAFQPRRRGPGPRGVDEAELMRHIGQAWELLSSRQDTNARPPWWLGGQLVWYRLQRLQVHPEGSSSTVPSGTP
jgi:SAM-dependent methyltransferase